MDSIEVVRGLDWQLAIARSMDAKGVMIVGANGSGKSTLAREVVEALSRTGRTATLLSADVGQPCVGVPTCLGASLESPWQAADASWFIGDTTPVGNLLPVVVGTARLAQLARCKGASAVVLDTSGLVYGPPARLLKYHKAIVAQIDLCIAIQRDVELEPLLSVLEGGPIRAVQRIAICRSARDRTPAERRKFREQRFGQHFESGSVREFPERLVIGKDWSQGSGSDTPTAVPGNLVGLLDADGFCLGLGIIQGTERGRLQVYTSCRGLDSVNRLRVGRLRMSQGEEVYQ